MGILRKLLGKTTTTDIIEVLTMQHAEVDALIMAIEKGSGNKRALFTASAQASKAADYLTRVTG